MTPKIKMEIRTTGKPFGQPRPRATRKGGLRIYNPDNGVEKMKEDIRTEAKKIFGTEDPPFTGPVILHALFLFPRPKSKIWKRKPMPREPHISRPDRDNLDKAVLDALTGIAYKDDSQVYSGVLTKVIAAGDEEPGILISIMYLRNN